MIVSQLVCRNCGKVSDILYADEYCDDCYSKNWDRGFEVTSEWAENIAHSDAISDINDDIETNSGHLSTDIRYVLTNFERSDWYCTACHAERLSVEEQITWSIESIANHLKSQCPDCGTIGNLGHHFKPS